MSHPASDWFFVGIDKITYIADLSQAEAASFSSDERSRQSIKTQLIHRNHRQATRRTLDDIDMPPFTRWKPGQIAYIPETEEWSELRGVVVRVDDSDLSICCARTGEVHLVSQDWCRRLTPTDVDEFAVALNGRYNNFPTPMLHAIVTDPLVSAAEKMLVHHFNLSTHRLHSRFPTRSDLYNFVMMQFKPCFLYAVMGITDNNTPLDWRRLAPDDESDDESDDE